MGCNSFRSWIRDAKKKEKRKGLGLIIIHEGYELTSGETNVGGATSRVWAWAASGAAPSKKKKKNQGWKRPLMWSTEEAKTSANFWSMCKQQFVRTADLTALLPLLRPAEIDGRIDESDTACKARPESSAEILNLFISSGSAENFPFIVADVFLNSAVENVRGL